MALKKYSKHVSNDYSKMLKYFSFIGVFSIFSTGMYYCYRFFKIWKKSNLSQFHEWHLNYIKALIKENKNKLNAEIISHIFFLKEEIIDYFFKIKFQEMEDNRLDSLADENMYLYQNYFAETYQTKNEINKKVSKILEKSFNVNLDKLKSNLDKSDKREVNYYFKKCKNDWRFYESIKYFVNSDTLSAVKKNILKEAYKFYAENTMKIENLIKEELQMMRSNRQEHLNLAMTGILIKKYQISDEIKLKFNIEDKLLGALINKYDLVATDSQIRYLKEELDNLNSVIDQFIY